MSNIIIRAATDEDLAAVAELRWQWALERKHTPVTTRSEFIAQFAQWARANASFHHCTVAVRGDKIIGMAWLAILRRVPTPRDLERAGGDMQCVYVVPEERNTGLGSRLINNVLTRAQELGLERVTVHSSVRAVPAYSRRGFAATPVLLQAEVAPLGQHPSGT